LGRLGGAYEQDVISEILYLAVTYMQDIRFT
jgi:hypothetical protein